MGNKEREEDVAEHRVGRRLEPLCAVDEEGAAREGRGQVKAEGRVDSQRLEKEVVFAADELGLARPQA